MSEGEEEAQEVTPGIGFLGFLSNLEQIPEAARVFNLGESFLTTLGGGLELWNPSPHKHLGLSLRAGRFCR